MIPGHYVGGLAALLGPILALVSIPALAVVQQRMDFSGAQDIQSATLILEDSDEIVTGTVQEEDGEKFILFILPDGSEGKSATALVVVDGRRQSYPLVIGQPTPVISAGSDRPKIVETDGAWYFGPGLYAGNLSSDFATVIAQQSAADASALLAMQGITNIVGTSDADDSSFAWGGIIEVGYRFSSGSRLSLNLQFDSVDDFGLNAGASGDIPMSTSIASAESVAVAELDMWSLILNYSRPFTPTSNFGFVLSAGSLSVERASSFTSTLSVDGMPFGEFTGDEKVDENVLQYGVGLEWTQRQARNWVPTIGIRYLQTADLDIFDKEQIRRLEAYFTIRRPWVIR
jgi:hypothetical protein